MAKLVTSGRFAVLREIPANSKYHKLLDVSGVLEIWESEHSYPGKCGALFYYPITLNRHGVTALRYLKTSFSYDVYEEGSYVYLRRGTRCYIFEIQDAIISLESL